MKTGAGLCQSRGQSDKKTGCGRRTSCGGTTLKVPAEAWQKNNRRSLRISRGLRRQWGALSYNFKDDTTEILLLAEWDTILSHRFAMRAVEHFRIHHNDKLPDKIVLTFIGPEQRSRRYDNKFEAGN